MTPLNFSVSLAGAAKAAPAVQATRSEFVVEVARDGYQGAVIQGIPEGNIIQAKSDPVIIEAQPEVIQAQSCQEQSPCLLTPPASQEPHHDDGWYIHQ